MFQDISEAPRDAILGLTEAFKRDPNGQKINLSVGVYQDDSGKTPVLECVRRAEQILEEQAASKAYLPIDGGADYRGKVQSLLLGDDHEAVSSGRAATTQTPGGTGALRVAADFLHANLPSATLWMSQPTWPNHPNVFAAANLPTKTYPYFDKASNGLATQDMLDAIGQMPAGDVILLHGCCHNPTGIDPSPQVWEQLADAVYAQGLLPLIDFAYQGFADGVVQDATGLRAFCRPGKELLVCSSFSKNFGLYSERVGALTAIAADSQAVGVVQSQIKRCVRANYSNPPAHGAAIVNTVLSDKGLTAQWEEEVAEMRNRINSMRAELARQLTDKGAPGDWSFIEQQRGMFSFSGLSSDQVDKLRESYSIYIVGSGRINVAGITSENIGRLTDAIVEVMG